MSKLSAPSSSRYNNGIFKITNNDKYIGDPTKVYYRSSLEYVFCMYCDLSPRIKKWGYEIMYVDYYDSSGKHHKYYPDFYLEVNNPDKNINNDVILIEVKPKRDVTSTPPSPPKRITSKTEKNYVRQILEWEKNMQKWNAVKNYCDRKGWSFLIVTETVLKRLRSELRGDGFII